MSVESSVSCNTIVRCRRQLQYPEGRRAPLAEIDLILLAPQEQHLVLGIDVKVRRKHIALSRMLRRYKRDLFARRQPERANALHVYNPTILLRRRSKRRADLPHERRAAVRVALRGVVVRQRRARLVRRLEQCVAQVDGLEAALAHRDEHRAAPLDVESLEALDVAEFAGRAGRGGARGVHVLVAPQELALQHGPAADVDDRRAVPAARGEEQRGWAEVLGLF